MEDGLGIIRLLLVPVYQGRRTFVVAARRQGVESLDPGRTELIAGRSGSGTRRVLFDTRSAR